MSIKNLKPTKKSGFNQGYFNPKNPQKYIGSSPIIYRSSWEYKFMIWCDINDKVLCWSSEPVEIKYWSRQGNKQRTYNPDFYFKILKQDGSTEEFLAEIKPKNQIQKPTPPANPTKKSVASYKFLTEQYIKNMDKYNAAKEYAESRCWRFIVLTEDTIKNGLH
jgi:hypothetical protein